MSIEPFPAGWRRNYADHHETHYIYRCYDAVGVLLYIGCSVNPAKRIAQHKTARNTASRWVAACMASYEVDGDTYKGRIVGQAAEAAAILAEQPVFNTQGRKQHNSSVSRDLAAQYLIAHGHLDLALETACTCWGETADIGACDRWCTPHVVEGLLPIFDSRGDYCEMAS